MNYLNKYKIENLDNLNLHQLIEHEEFINVIKKVRISNY